MNLAETENLFESFKSKTILVIGDLMIDAYIYGRVDRISPEAPVPVLSVTKEETRPGGAANVALNLRSLGAKTLISGVTGNDPDADVLISSLETSGINTPGILRSSKRPTTRKTRIIGNHYQMLRVDHEQTDNITTEEEHELFEKIARLSSDVDAIIFEDYNKGVLTKTLIAKLTDFAHSRKIPTAVDPKKNNFLSYHNVTLYKPNLKEIREGLKIDGDITTNDALKKATSELHQHLNNKYSLITLSERGVVITDHHETFLHIPAHVRDIADVSGAGDTVIAVAALALAAGCDAGTIAGLANIAGGLVCEHPGVVPVDREELMREAVAKL